MDIKGLDTRFQVVAGDSLYLNEIRKPSKRHFRVRIMDKN